MKTLFTIFVATFLFAGTAVAQSPKFDVNFVKTKVKIKGTWDDWSPTWTKPAKKSYVQVSMITENRVYNIRYYEDAKKIRDYDVTYDDKKTQQVRKDWKNENVWCYKINDSNDDWVFLKGGSFGVLYKEPTKWMNTTDAQIYFMDDEKFPHFTTVK